MFVGGGLGERIYWDFSEDNLPSGKPLNGLTGGGGAAVQIMGRKCQVS